MSKSKSFSGVPANPSRASDACRTADMWRRASPAFLKPSFAWLEARMKPRERAHNPWLGAAAVAAAFSAMSPLAENRDDRVVHPAEDFRSRYTIFEAKHLGTGVAAQVFRGQCRFTREPVAVKVFKRCESDREQSMLVDMLNTEVQLMHRVGRHKNVVGLRGHYSGSGTPIRMGDGSALQGDSDVLVLDLAEGGELFELVASHGSLLEDEALTIVKDLLRGMRHLHSRGVVHLDLKPENLLLARPVGAVRAEENHIKIADFGVSRILAPGARTQGSAGTIAYWAPEMVKREKWDHAVDMWAVGCLIYILLCGAHPFDLEGNATDAEVSKRVAEGDRSWEEDTYFMVLSPQAKMLIRGLLEEDPKKRLTASQALHHEWCNLKSVTPAFLDFGKAPIPREDSRFLPENRRNTRLRGFNNLQKVRPKILAVLAGQRLASSAGAALAPVAVASSRTVRRITTKLPKNPEDVWLTRSIDADVAEVYGEVFRAIDRDHNGEISVEELKGAFEMLGQNLTDKELAQMMKDGDITKNNSLSFDEFISLVVKRLGQVEPTTAELLQRTFNFFDETGSGFITAEALQHMLAIMGEDLTVEDANAIIRYCDSSGDGKITFEEFKQLIEKLMAYKD